MPALLRILLPLVAVLLTAPAAAADSRVTARIDGPSTVQRGQEVTYYVTIRNAGSQTLGTGRPRLRADLDAVPSGNAPLSGAVLVDGTGPWECSASDCVLARGATLPPGAIASFAIRAKILGAVTLDFDVTGNEVAFSNVRKSVRTSGTLLPVVYGLALPATVSPRTPAIGFTLSEATRVAVRLERISTRWRLSRRVGRRVVRSQRCSDRRPKVRRTTRVRKGVTRCSPGMRTLATYSGPRGFNLLDVPQLRTLTAGRRYRLRLLPRTRDGRQGREARSLVFRTTR